ncbi:exodeoxyribonuclease VII small subunit [Proteiniclasticum sp. BAD-10]|jgi:exodeoxyribonuclease VII small subunit|uniref:Exodeoxyribonuclease 7 small subunit n=1 Tax=Proteiniclasticum sediminis TaxID=2804028 RepID=A0A941CNV7_9CLOT|nr:exodeoxyribonuclease VII small subunit [Proteiniclasticum sediminis]MBR0574954.1 exodeoxyribonuclease VII small subunit [Proteiniclasticum sediminis]
MKKKTGYQELMNKLEEILAALETGDISLEDAMLKYEEGVALTKELQAILAKAEEKVKIMDDEKEVEF